MRGWDGGGGRGGGGGGEGEEGEWRGDAESAGGEGVMVFGGHLGGVVVVVVGGCGYGG